MSFAKLDSGIVNSTLWVLPDDVLRVWIWLLSQADANGVVRTAAPALALVCMKAVDRIREIMLLLESPDPDSRSEVDEGRRLRKVSGGWQIINYRAYRERVAADEKRENDRARIAEKRASARTGASNVAACSDVSQPVANVAQAEVEEEAEEARALKEPDLRSGVGTDSADPASATTDVENGATDTAPPERIPIAKIVDLYHIKLPHSPRVEKITKVRAGYIRQRWREDLPSLDAWANYFDDVGKSRFLTGQLPGRDGKPPFVADLEWLTRPSNFAKVAEGKYHR